MNPIADTETPAPWYKQFWLWFIVFFPALAIVAGVITIYIAVANEDSLVRDDYYKAGLAINADLAQDKIAVQKNIQATLIIDTAVGDLQLSLSGELAELPANLALQFIHPTSQDKDFKLNLKQRLEHNYNSQIPAILKGRWHLQLSDEGSVENANQSWRLRSSINFSEQHNERISIVFSPST